MNARSTKPAIVTLSIAALLVLLLLPLAVGTFYFNHPTLHTAVEMLGAIPAIFFAALLFAQCRRGERDVYLYPVALGLLTMGILDAFHAVSAAGTPGFVWLRSLAGVCGGLFSALTWAAVSRRLPSYPLHWAAVAICVAIGIFFLFEPYALPAVDAAGNFTLPLNAINIIGGLSGLVAMAYFITRYRRTRYSGDLIFTAFFLVISSAALIFPFSRLWEGEWWLWHVLRLIAYAFAIHYIFTEHVSLMSGMKLEITERSRAETALRESEQRFRVLVENAPEAIIVFDLDTDRVVDANSKAEHLFGCPRVRLLNGSLADFDSSQKTDTSILHIRSHDALNGSPLVFESTVRHAEGREIICEVSLVELPSHGRRLVRAGYTDITQRKAAEAQIEFLAYHDALTQLPNRLLAKDHMEMAVSYAERSGNKVGLLFLDLDEFKTVNDSLGHLIGDALLKSIAARLSGCIRPTDTLARLGGDEFLIVLADVHDADIITDVSEHILEQLSQPFDVEGHELSTSFSLGIAVYPDDGRDFETLLMKADTAMYHAKDAGRNTYRYHTEKMNLDAIEHLQIRNSLRKALERNEFVLHYQPQIDLRAMKVTGVEALIRWNHPVFGLVAPMRFIPIAEDSGLIVPIGEWVLAEACRQAVAWQRAGLAPIAIAVNLSAVQFRRGNVEVSVRRALAHSGLDPALLELELTESILIQNTEKVLTNVQALKGLGIKLSVDDFGTGYSSLAYLKRFNVDKLKIDQSFVHDMVDDPNDAAIIGAIIQMAHSLNLRAIAEGVENEATLAALRRSGCDEAQGYYFARPMPADMLGDYLRKESNGAGLPALPRG